MSELVEGRQLAVARPAGEAQDPARAKRASGTPSGAWWRKPGDRLSLPCPGYVKGLRSLR
jgi:hypothetical protein